MEPVPLPHSVRRSFLLSFAQRHVDVALRFAGTLVLARLIPPDEFGVYVVAAGIVGLLWILGEFGLPQYLIKAEKLGTEERSRILGLAILASSLVAALACGSAIVIPDVWAGPETKVIFFVLGLSILPQPLVSLFRAELQRDMRFDVLLRTNTVAVAGGVASAIILAAVGYGAVGLAWANLIEALCFLVFALTWQKGMRLPRPALRGWGAIARFGRSASMIDAVRHAGELAPSLALGMAAGLGPAGLFSRAQTVTSLFDRALFQAVSPVVLPLLAERVRRGEEINNLYLLKVTYLAVLSWPFFAFLALWASPIVELLLGRAWMDAVPVIQLLCLGGILLPFNQMNQKFFVVLGLIDFYLRIQLLSQGGKLIAVFCLAVVSFRLMALAIFIEQLLKFVLSQRLLYREFFYPKAQLTRDLFSSAVCTGLAILSAASVSWLWNDSESKLALLPLAAILAVAGWTIGIFLSGHPLRQELMRALSYPRNLVRREL